MFDRVGEKIKLLAVAWCLLGMAASIVAAAVLWCNNDSYTPTILKGILVLVSGCAGVLASALLIYGFGELIDDTKKTHAYLEQLLQKDDGAARQNAPKETAGVKSPVANTNASLCRAVSRGREWRCVRCGSENPAPATFCKDCGSYR